MGKLKTERDIDNSDAELEMNFAIPMLILAIWQPSEFQMPCHAKGHQAIKNIEHLHRIVGYIPRLVVEKNVTVL